MASSVGSGRSSSATSQMGSWGRITWEGATEQNAAELGYGGRGMPKGDAIRLPGTPAFCLDIECRSAGELWPEEECGSARELWPEEPAGRGSKSADMGATGSCT